MTKTDPDLLTMAKPQPKGEAWLSKACTEGKHHQCTGKIGFIPGKCECACHLAEKPKQAA
jgi:hypothetical protein